MTCSNRRGETRAIAVPKTHHRSETIVNLSKFFTESAPYISIGNGLQFPVYLLSSACLTVAKLSENCSGREIMILDIQTEEKTALEEQPLINTKNKKPLSFHLSFLGVLVMVFIVSLDTTTRSGNTSDRSRAWRHDTRIILGKHLLYASCFGDTTTNSPNEQSDTENSTPSLAPG